MRPLDLFILLQNADGSFARSDDFMEAISKTRDLVIGAMPDVVKNSNLSAEEKETIWVTAIAISFLAFKFSANKDEWELLCEKSSKFVRRILEKNNIKVQEVLDAAHKVFA